MQNKSIQKKKKMTFKNERQRKAFFAKLKNSNKLQFQDRIKFGNHFRLRKEAWEQLLERTLRPTKDQRKLIPIAVTGEDFTVLKPLLKGLPVKEQAKAQVQFKNAVKNQKKQREFGTDPKSEFRMVLGR